VTEVFELRQYTLHPGKRDVLIDLFDREFVETQEALGIRVVGQFRDVDDPDRFVWFRGFPDMVRRHEALTRFYGGPVWKAHRNVANATMIDSDDVLLLRLVNPRLGFPAPCSDRPPVGASERPSSLFSATIYSFRTPVTDELVDLVPRDVAPLTLLRTEPAENTYPALPVRTGENVIVAFTAHDSRGGEVPPALREYLSSLPRRLTLEPTARSMLR
jgi:NIPSNAP